MRGLIEQLKPKILFLTVLGVVSWMPVFGKATLSEYGLPKCFAVLNKDRTSKPFIKGAKSEEFQLAIDSDTNPNKFRATYLVKSVLVTKDFRVVVLRTESRWVTPSKADHAISTSSLFKQNQEMFLDQVMPLVDAANEKFEVRRGWGQPIETAEGSINSFSKVRIEVAENFLLNSSYVLVHDHQGKLLGGIRNIQILDEGGIRLPEEESLEIVVPQFGMAAANKNHIQWKNEIGSYYIDENQTPEVRQKVFVSIWTELYRFLGSKESVAENFYNQVYHSYGDYKTAKMNRSLGFKKLRVYKYKGEWRNYSDLAEEDIPPILLEGETEWKKGWWPLYLMPKDLQETNQRISREGVGKITNNWILENRHRLVNDDQGLFQLGSLFEHLLSDLQSPDPKIFKSAKDGIMALIKALPEHKAIAYDFELRHTSTSFAIENIIDLRDKINNFLLELPKLLQTMDYARRKEMVAVIGDSLKTEETGDFFSVFEVMATLLSDADPMISRGMAQYLREIKTPKKWLSAKLQVLDLSIPKTDSTGRIFYSEEDKQEYHQNVFSLKEKKYSSLLEGGFAETDLNLRIKNLRVLLFRSRGHSSSELAGIDAFLSLPKSDRRLPADQAMDLISLASAIEYLENPIFD